MPLHLGSVAGIEPGHEFLNRLDVKAAGLHRDSVKGIASLKGNPAEAIVLSGGYEDDLDLGSVILYTGEGGNQEGRQVADQQLQGGNLALQLSFEQQTPVRVIRKVWQGKTPFYQYAGLYLVTRSAAQMGRSGHLIWQFRLEMIAAESALDSATTLVQEPAVAYEPTPRQLALTNRLVRDTRLMRIVKELYDFSCQVCAARLPTPSGPYAEAAHIRGLGGPHHGPDKLDNLLCLCPNHHLTFDRGSWSVNDDGTLRGQPGRLTLAPAHEVNPLHLHYHRRRIYQPHSAPTLF
ncbi:YDG/SRA domain-containing protein [Hymenobacter psychrophilus]|uniref:YDG/SRA domain-containing protein n=1 Tax=Hymenobacter psychrophilus TaxID=651662 RepID=UPI000B81A003|nr:YDG/SRA domain-containing protein [Hymenobacter psychrophilus]